MNLIQDLGRIVGLFVLGLVATLTTPDASAAPMAAPVAQDHVECTMLLTWCPDTGEITYECLGDCHPFEGSCELATIGDRFHYCHCVGEGGGQPLYAQCTLVYDSVLPEVWCANVSCPGTCPLWVDEVDGKFQVYCLC